MKITRLIFIILMTLFIYVLLILAEYLFFNVIDIHVSYVKLFFATYNVCIVGMVSFLTSLNLHENNWN